MISRYGWTHWTGRIHQTSFVKLYTNIVALFDVEIRAKTPRIPFIYSRTGKETVTITNNVNTHKYTHRYTRTSLKNINIVLSM